jgi:hypothetical protein
MMQRIAAPMLLLPANSIMILKSIAACSVSNGAFWLAELI